MNGMGDGRPHLQGLIIMALSEFETKRIEELASLCIEQLRPPEHIRQKVDISFRIQDQSVEIYEVRPQWQNPDRKIEVPIAKATYVKTTHTWKVFWQRADMKWHRYDVQSEVASLEDFFSIVKADEYGCFFG